MNEYTSNPEYRHFEVEIVDATAQDAEQIAALRKKTWFDTYPNEEYNITREDIAAKDFDSDKKIQQLRDYIEESDASSKTWVAKEDGGVVGYCTSTKYGQHEIRAIYVLPDKQGLGIGKKLMETALQWLGDTHDVYLYVASYSEESIAFYKKLGFEVSDKPTPEGYAVNGKPIPLTTMVRPASHSQEILQT
jgi:ribosomal protein S18 acetylase RimI-like enzyme